MAAIRFKIVIRHRYLETGHIHMECDSVHARIEGKTRNLEVYTPKQWYNYIRSAKTRLPRYEVIEMGQEKFFNVKLLEEHQHWKNIRTSKIREIEIDGSKPGMIAFKNDFAQETKVLSVFPIQPGRPVNWSTFKLTRMYNSLIPVPAKLLKGLQKLCQEDAIPAVYKCFFMETLPAINAAAAGADPVQAVVPRNTTEEDEAEEVDEPESNPDADLSCESDDERSESERSDSNDETDQDEESDTEQ